jgi:hypothetical protein
LTAEILFNKLAFDAVVAVAALPLIDPLLVMYPLGFVLL